MCVDSLLVTIAEQSQTIRLDLNRSFKLCFYFEIQLVFQEFSSPEKSNLQQMMFGNNAMRQ